MFQSAMFTTQHEKFAALLEEVSASVKILEKLHTA